jgi:hypothetical protein
MQWAFAFGASLGVCSLLPAAHPEPIFSAIPDQLLSPSSMVSGARRAAVMQNLTRLQEATVRRAIDLALAKLAFPGCAGIYEDFELPNGDTPQRVLDRMGIGPEELLESLVFVDGSRNSFCRRGKAVLTTTPGSQVIGVCPGFAAFQLRDPGLSASIIIHESLHALGLGENPPSSREITQRVERRCWKAVTRAPGSGVGKTTAAK